MNIYVSIVSHNNMDFIIKNHDLLKINVLENVKIFIKDNIGQTELKDYCKKNNITYLYQPLKLGFGANNNYVFQYIYDHYKPNNNDCFLLLNPDVYISLKQFEILINELLFNKYEAFTIDLYKDKELTLRDPFIRLFPKCSDFLYSYLFNRNKTIIDRENIKYQIIEWCAGSFMGFTVDTFLSLKGFDEGYFMYCEDIDICYRASKLGINISYLGNIKAVHLAQHLNRNFMSKSFIWHIKSIIRYLLISRFPRLSNLIGFKFKSII